MRALLVMLLVLPLLLPATGAWAGTTARPGNAASTLLGTAELETRIPSLIKDAHIPGLQIAVVRDGEVVWHGSFGVKDGTTGEPVTEETIFNAASLTKPFFAYYAMMLVDQGLLDLDRPLVAYVPREKIEGAIGHSIDEEGFHRDWLEKITVRHVLSHSGGLPHGDPRSGTYPLQFEPGAKWKYSADGYLFLQWAVEEIKGDKLENLMRREVIEPLGMTRSSLVWKEDYEPTIASGHDFFGRPGRGSRWSEADAGGSLYTTAGDYARFVCAVLNGEHLGPETLAEMLRPQIDMGRGEGLGWSLGFGTQADDRGAAIWQWGDENVFRNYVMAYPEEKSAVVYLANSVYGLGIAPELVAWTIGGRATGSIALEYRHYDWPVYRALWAWTEKGPAAAGGAAGLAREFPEAFSKDGIVILRAIFEGGGRLAEFAAPLQYYADAHPCSGEAQFALAAALIQAGEWGQAETYLERASKADEDKVPPEAVTWKLEYLRALKNPKQLDESRLKRIAGTYGARQLEFRDGRLWYSRKGGRLTDPQPLIAMSEDIFVLETLPYFRLKIAFDERGDPVKTVGIYEDGRQDETAREESGTEGARP